MLEGLNNFHFIRPLWLLFSVPVVGIWWWWQRSVDPLEAMLATAQKLHPSRIDTVSKPIRNP
jgi:hypothetical protein